MKHINEAYGHSANYLKLTSEEYTQLEPFLRALGVRTRMTESYGGEITIQGENPYHSWLQLNKGIDPMVEHTLKCGDDEMTDYSIMCYRR